MNVGQFKESMIIKFKSMLSITQVYRKKENYDIENYISKIFLFTFLLI